MGNEAREKLYDKVQNDTELCKLICLDTSDNDLLSFIKPNKQLEAKCLPFLKKGKIANKNAIAAAIANQTQSNRQLTKLITLTWLEKNAATVKFIETNLTKSVLEDLNSGKFGDIKKIKILSNIDTRQGIKQYYDNYFKLNEHIEENEKAKICQQMPTKAIDESELNEALNKIKILEQALETVKQTNKEQKILIEQKNKELSAISAKLSENKQNADISKKENVEFAETIKTLRTKLDFSEKETQKLKNDLSEALEAKSKRDSLSLELEVASKEAALLKERISAKDSLIKRLENENGELKQILKSDENSGKTIINLQNKLKILEHELELTPVFGQIADSCLFISIHGDAYTLSESLAKQTELINEEYAILYLDKENIPIKLLPIESEEKSEVFGVVKSNQGSFFLETEYNQIPIYVSVAAKQIGKPAKGIILPEVFNRPEGIYYVLSLSDASLDKTQSENKASQIKKYKSKDTEPLETTKQFNGEKLLIIGGDRVGHEYERILAKSNLNISWRSGFESIADLRKGLTNYDAVVIIIKQLSHTLLREITSAAKRDKVLVIYSARRGISGVLAELENKL